jgi:glutamine amidotransferase
MPDDTRFYFVHSYAPTATEAQAAAGVQVATAVHGEPFVAAFETDVLRATQFHPEKSGDAGATLLANWLRTL